MQKKRFSEEQIIHILKAQETGLKAIDICRREGIPENTFYTWKKKFGGMDISEVKRLKALEQENTSLKRLVADLSLDNRVLKDIVEKKL